VRISERMSDDFRDAASINPGFKKSPFSKIEIRDITISVLVLAVAFTIILSRANPRFFSSDYTTNVLYWFGTSIVLVITSFLCHELGHKFVAQRYGAWSEYRMFPAGLLFCLILSFVGILFAAPGAVYIRGRIDDKMNGKISAAGPGVNIILGYIAFALALATTGFSSAIFGLLAYLNAFLALFNMIPIPPLDGSKIVKWNIPVFVIMVALAALLLYFVW
jgi:Zn-dependent protease